MSPCIHPEKLVDIDILTLLMRSLKSKKEMFVFLTMLAHLVCTGSNTKAGYKLALCKAGLHMGQDAWNLQYGKMHSAKYRRGTHVDMHPDEGYGGPHMIPGYAGAYKNSKAKVI